MTTFHNNQARTGVYVDAALTRAAVAGIHIDTTFANTAIMGPVYAQPLYLGGAGSSQPDMVVVATGQNRVYALNASTGAEVWPNVQFGTPITSKTGTDINSGNIRSTRRASSARRSSTPRRARFTSARTST